MPTDPRPLLRALTPEAEAALGGRREVAVEPLPFRIGRECRVAGAARRPHPEERRRGGVRPNNDLYLLDPGERKHISREHCRIVRDGGGWQVEDRGSALGTLVGSRRIGGDRRMASCALRTENVIVLGTAESPYVFQFLEDGGVPGE